MRGKWKLCVWTVVVPSWLFGQVGRDLLAGEVFGKDRTALGVSVFPSASIWLRSASGAVTGENVFSTGIMAYHMSLAVPGKSNGWVFSAARSGTPTLHQSYADIGWCKALSPELGLSIRVGYGSMVARGYEAKGGPSTGLGLGWKVTERFTWLFQVSNVQVVMNGQGNMAFELKSGIGYQFSDLCLGFAQVQVRNGMGTGMVIGLEYRPDPRVALKIGYGDQLLMFAAGYQLGLVGLQVFSSWHMALGLSQGLSVACNLRRAE